MAGCHTLLHLCKSVLYVGDFSLQEASVRSVGSVGIQFSHRFHRFSQMVGCVSGCVGMAGCHTLLHLCKSVLSVGDFSLQEASVRSVGSVEYSSPTDFTDSHRWLVALVRPRNPQNSQKFGCVSGGVGTAGCHTLLHLCKSVLSVGGPSLQETSVGSVGSVGIQFSHRLHRFSQMIGCVSGCVGTAGCHTLLHLCKSVLSVEDFSLQEASVGSVRSVGIQFSHGLH